MQNRLALVGLVIIAIFVLIALFAELLAPYDPLQIFSGRRGAPPSPGHPLGFDITSRDLLSRMIFGTRFALLVGLVASAIAVTIGMLLGALAGYFGGWVDVLISRVIDTLMGFPIIALLVVLASVIGPSLLTTILVIGFTGWASYARIVRADVMSIRERDFVLAARALGVSNMGIIWRHILPNVLGPIIVLATLGIGGVIILESALSFLGLGVPPEAPSWGRILNDGRSVIMIYPHISIAPGVAIFLMVLAFNFVGDGLRDALDPRQKE
jgi:peptide/nickel transport system permease protein